MPPGELVMGLARKLKGNGRHCLRKQAKVAFVTADRECPTHVLMHGESPESPELQERLRTEHVNIS